MRDSAFRVVIIGGGIGGLTLACSLQHAGIDFVIIEKGKVLDPQVGASIGILPNGARILDQIGCFDDVAALTVPMVSTASHKADGSLIGSVSDTLRLLERRTGYAVSFLDRQLLLRTIARRIQMPGRILLNTNVQNVEQYHDRAVVYCADGTTVEADVVVGADGVHSLVRQEMWRHAHRIGEGDKFALDEKAMSAEYKCLFGISSSLTGMQPGQTDRTYAHGVSTLSYVGKEGRVFWFIFIKMDQTYYPPHIPKFASEDVAAEVERIGSLAIREAGAITVSNLYHSHICCNLVAIEEAEYQYWSYGRLVCLGDAIHKMTPNLGAGASSAIESAAVLSNFLVRAASSSEKPPLSAIRASLEGYQDARALRIGKVMAITNKLTRTQALQTKKDYVFAHYIAPWIDDVYAEAFSSFVIGAPIIDHLPVPTRSVQGTMPFNPKQGWGFEEPALRRARRACPFIGLAILYSLLSSKLIDPMHWTLPIGSRSYRYLFNSHQDQHIGDRALVNAINSAIVYGLWLLESARLNNKTTFVQFPYLFSLIWQYSGQGVAVSLYFFCLYILSPIEKFRASDNRLTDTAYTWSITPLIALVAMAPRCLGYDIVSFYENNDIINSWLPKWMISSSLLPPLFISTLQFLIAQYFIRSTVRADRIWDVRRDVIVVRSTTCLLAIISSASWLYGIFQHKDIFEAFSASRNALHTLRYMFQIEEIMLMLTATFWLGLVSRDLRDAGMTKIGWARVGVSSVLVSTFLGPTTTLVLGWQFREEILLSRRHQHAVTEGRVKKSK